MKISIRRQLGAGIGLLVFCALALSLIMMYHNLTEDYEEKVKIDNIAVADSLARDIAQFINNTNIMTQMAASYPNIKALSRTEQQQLLAGIVAHYPWVDLMALSDLEGAERVRSSGFRANNSDRIWFRQFMRTEKPSLSPVFYSLTSALPSVALTSGVYDAQGKLSAVMMSTINSATLQKMVDSYAVGEGREVYLLDSQGSIVTYPQQTQVDELYNYRLLKKQHLMRDQEGNLLRNDRGRVVIQQEDFTVDQSFLKLAYRVLDGETGVQEYTDETGERYLCAYRPVSFAGLDDRWSLLVVQRYSDAMAFMKQSFYQSLWIMGIILLLALLGTAWYAGRFTRPIVTLAETIRKVQQGDLSVQVPVTEKNELGYLEQKFNAMIVSLEKNRQERITASQKIEQLAYHDSLTGLPNRVHFHLFLQHQLDRQLSGAVMFIDLDQFKEVNDTFGHSTGDRLLVQVSQRLRQTIGEHAFACRLGGDEFMLVLDGLTDMPAIQTLADQLIIVLAQEYIVDQHQLDLSASIGVARYPQDGNTVEELLRKADTAMYQAKNSGRNRWQVYKEV